MKQHTSPISEYIARMKGSLDIPPWREEYFDTEETEAGEEWKYQRAKDATLALYEQWRQFVYLLNGALPDDGDKDSYKGSARRHIIEDTFVVAAKIQSSQVLHYVGKMENAAIIRKAAAQDAFLALWHYREMNDTEATLEETHHQVLRTEFEKFQVLFKEWVGTFEKDDMVDEWGLF